MNDTVRNDLSTFVPIFKQGEHNCVASWYLRESIGKSNATALLEWRD